MKHAWKITTLALVAAITLPRAMLAQAVNFDELPTAAYDLLPTGYSGFSWFQRDGTFGTGDGLEYTSKSLTQVACRSLENCAYNAWGNTSIRIESIGSSAADRFSFKGWLSGAGFPGFAAGASSVRVESFLGLSSIALNTWNEALPTDGSWLAVDFTSASYNKLLFTPLDKNGNAFQYAPGDPSDGYILMDDVTFSTNTTVPEPSSLLLVGAGVSLLALRLRRRHSSAV